MSMKRMKKNKDLPQFFNNINMKKCFSFLTSENVHESALLHLYFLALSHSSIRHYTEKV